MDRRRAIMAARDKWQIANLANMPQWNQNVNVRSRTYTSNGLTVTGNATDQTVTLKGLHTGSSTSLVTIESCLVDYRLVLNHIYYSKITHISGTTTSTSSTTGQVYWQGYGYQNGTLTGHIFQFKAGDTRIAGCFKGSIGSSFTDYKIKLTLIDLTVLFGIGNVPSVDADFRALFPDDHYSPKTATANTDGAIKYEYEALDAQNEIYRYKEIQ